MRDNEAKDAALRLKLPTTLKQAFLSGCSERGLNMSALIRKDVEAHVNKFAEEDAETAA